MPEQRLAAEHDQPKVWQEIRVVHRIDQVAEPGREPMEHRNPRALQPARQAFDALRHDRERTQRGAAHERAEDVQPRRAERVGMKLRQPVFRRELQGVRVEHHLMQHVAMRLHHAFGPPGRAGGVEKVRERVRRTASPGLTSGNSSPSASTFSTSTLRRSNPARRFAPTRRGRCR